MNRLLIAAASAALLITAPALAADLVVDAPEAAPAVAPSGLYATFFAGGSFASGEISMVISPPLEITIPVDLEAGFIVGGAVGMSVYQNLRGELEFSYMQANVSTEELGFPDDLKLTSTGYNFLANLWYDFVNDTSFTPYVGAGVGYGYNETGADGYYYESSGLLYQLGAGVKFDVADNIALDVGYRYRVLSDADVTFNGVAPPAGFDVTTNATNHIVQAGVTFGF
jgi:opacity protein-like surface antigen